MVSRLRSMSYTLWVLAWQLNAKHVDVMLAAALICVRCVNKVDVDIVIFIINNMLIEKRSKLLTLDTLQKVMKDLKSEPEIKISFTSFIDINESYKMKIKNVEVWYFHSSLEQEMRSTLPEYMFMTNRDLFKMQFEYAWNDPYKERLWRSRD